MSLGVVGGRVYTPGGLREADVLVEDGTISEIGDSVEADETLDAEGDLLLPGAVDLHVHFREPGATHKEDWRSGSRSAAAGGVTTVVDQPNTEPPTVDGAAFDLKLEAAAGSSLVDFGLNAGVTPTWRPDELFERPVAAFGEVFMADSTGEMGVSGDVFEDAVRRVQRRGGLVTVHAEDSSMFEDVELSTTDDWSRRRPPEAEVAAVERAVEAADRPLHFAHVSHPDSVDLISPTKHTCEVTPHHLLLSRDDLPDLGTLGKMNPPLRREDARRGLWRRLVDGDVDCVATDHAPHTLEEKHASVADAPSGVPGVETMLPLLLALHSDGDLDLDRVVDLTSERPAEVFGFEAKGRVEPGFDADIVVVDTDVVESVRADRLHSRCGWTPFEGFDAVYPRVVLRRGEVAYERTEEGERFAEGGGRNLVSD